MAKKKEFKNVVAPQKEALSKKKVSEKQIDKWYREEYLPYCEENLKGIASSDTWAIFLFAKSTLS